jgi:hypothetical protein
MYAGIRVGFKLQTQLRRLKRTLQRFALAQLLGYLSWSDRRLRGGFMLRLLCVGYVRTCGAADARRLKSQVVLELVDQFVCHTHEASHARL